MCMKKFKAVYLTQHGVACCYVRRAFNIHAIEPIHSREAFRAGESSSHQLQLFPPSKVDDTKTPVEFFGLSSHMGDGGRNALPLARQKAYPLPKNKRSGTFRKKLSPNQKKIGFFLSFFQHFSIVS